MIDTLKYRDTIRRAAKHTAPVLASLGMVVDDCEQEGHLALLGWWSKQPDGTEPDPRFVYVLVRRALIKVGRGLHVEDQPEDSWLEGVEARSPSVTAELSDLIDSAPEYVRQYLGFRVLCGMTWDETREAIGCCNDRLCTIRATAAEYVLAAMEGRR